MHLLFPLKYGRLLTLYLLVFAALVASIQAQSEGLQINDLAWSSTSKYLAIATTEGILLYDTEDDWLTCLQNCSISNISNITFNPDDRILAYSITDTSSVFLFSLDEQRVISEIQTASEGISTLEFRDASYLAIGGFGYGPDRIYRGYFRLYFVQIDEDKIGDIIIGREVKQLREIREVSELTDISFHEDFMFASMMSSGLNPNIGDILIYNMKTNSAEIGSYRWSLRYPPRVSGNLALIPRIVGEYETGQLSLVNLSTDEVLLEDNLDTAEVIRALDLSLSRAVYADSMENVNILDFSTGERHTLDQGNTNTIKLIEVSDSLVAIVRRMEEGDTLEIWDIEDKSLLKEVDLSPET